MMPGLALLHPPTPIPSPRGGGEARRATAAQGVDGLQIVAREKARRLPPPPWGRDGVGGPPQGARPPDKANPP
jgi:hypothetical protein